jgi:hypothetical protein
MRHRPKSNGGVGLMGESDPCTAIIKSQRAFCVSQGKFIVPEGYFYPDILVRVFASVSLTGYQRIVINTAVL